MKNKRIGLVSINSDLSFFPLSVCSLRASLLSNGFQEPVILLFSISDDPEGIVTF